jgi:hypothetical protein
MQDLGRCFGIILKRTRRSSHQAECEKRPCVLALIYVPNPNTSGHAALRTAVAMSDQSI